MPIGSYRNITPPSRGGDKNVRSSSDRFYGGVLPPSRRERVQQEARQQEYFAAVTESGASLGFSDKDRDPSGRPYFAYREPGSTATTTDYSRVATTFDPRKPQKLTRDEYYNPRSVDERQAIKEAMGASYSDELDHKIALAISGSNHLSNLQLLPKEENREFGVLETKLAMQVRNGEKSLFDAQVEAAKAKGLPLPFTGKDEKENWIKGVLKDAKKIVSGEIEPMGLSAEDFEGYGMSRIPEEKPDLSSYGISISPENETVGPGPIAAFNNTLMGFRFPVDIPEVELPKIEDPGRRVRNQDWIDVINFFPQMLGEVVSSMGSASASIYEALTGKSTPEIKVPAFGGDEERGTFLDIQSSQNYYLTQIGNGVPENQAFFNTAVKTVGDITIATIIGRDIAKLTALRTAPEKLIEVRLTKADRNMVNDFLTGRSTTENLNMPDQLKVAITDILANGSRQEKKLLFQGVDLLQVKPTRLGQILGVSPAEAERIMINVYGSPIRQSPVGLLPGYRDIPGQSPALGLSTRATEPAGFGVPRRFTEALSGQKNVSKEFVTDLIRRSNLNLSQEAIVRGALASERESIVVESFLRKIEDTEEIASLEKTAKETAGEEAGIESVVGGQKKTRDLESGVRTEATDAEIDKQITTKKARGQSAQPENIIKSAATALSPLSSLDDVTKNILRQWYRDSLVVKEQSVLEKRKYPELSGVGIKELDRYQLGKETPNAEVIRTAFDSLYNEAVARGLDIPYRVNYVPQVYSQSPRKIQESVLNYLLDNNVDKNVALEYLDGKTLLPENTAKRLKLSPTFEKDRVFPTYAIAKKYGLTPRYDNAADLVQNYKLELGKALNNRQLLDELQESGKILPDVSAPQGWSKLNANFTGRTTYEAPGQLAKVLNGVFEDQAQRGFGNQLASVVAGFSKVAQTITLSGGIPFTDLNFFAIGQLVKELTAGNYKAVNAFLRANSNAASVKYFERHKDSIMAMAERGIDLTGRTGVYSQETMRQLLKDKRFGRLIGTGFNRVVEQKTFQNFLPQLQVQLFEDLSLRFTRKGLTKTEAYDASAEIISRNFGLNLDSFARSRLTNDVLSTLFFAPRFRETIVRTLAYTGKAGYEIARLIATMGRKKTSRALYKNRLLLLGMILSYGIYDHMNRMMNGHHIWENPKNRQFALRIPYKSLPDSVKRLFPEGEVIYIEYMPSFLAFARNMFSGGIAIFKGDFDTAGQKIGSLFSMPLKIASEVLTNKDYFGRPIYADTDRTRTKAWKMAQYVGLNINHPYVREFVNQIQEDKPVAESLVYATEFPIRFSTEDKEARSAYYDMLEKRRQIRARAKADFQPKYDEIRFLVEQGNVDKAQEMLEELSAEEYELYKEMRASEKRTETRKAKSAFFPTFEQIQGLVQEGRGEEARAILDSLTEEEYEYYKALKKQQ